MNKKLQDKYTQYKKNYEGMYCYNCRVELAEYRGEVCKECFDPDNPDLHVCIQCLEDPCTCLTEPDIPLEDWQEDFLKASIKKILEDKSVR